MWGTKPDRSLLAQVQNEQFPDLRPLLRFLSKSTIHASSTLDCIREALESATVPQLMKCYIHGVMWEAWTGDSVQEPDDVFSVLESWTIPFEHYAEIVVCFKMESLALRSFCLVPSFRDQLISVQETTSNYSPLLMMLLDVKDPVKQIADLDESTKQELESWFLGSALAHVSVQRSKILDLNDPALLEDMILYLIDLPTVHLYSPGLLETFLEVLVSLLEHLKDSGVQLRMLEKLQESTGYRTVLDCLETSAPLVKLAKQRTILITNQILELRIVQNGVLLDEASQQEHLMNWISEFYPCLVLFPETVVAHLVMNGLLNDAQQRLITQILDFYSPVLLHEEQDLVMEALKETTTKMENLPSQNVSAFVQYCVNSKISRTGFFIKEICLPRFENMVQPGPTIEGLIESCCVISSRNELDLKILQGLFPVLEMFCFPGYSSEPNWETFVLLLETLLNQCVQSITKSKQDFSGAEITQFCIVFRELDWRMRILFSPVLLHLSPEEDLEILFSPEDIHSYDEAYLWIYRITKFLLLITVHEHHPLNQIQDQLKQSKEILKKLPGELISWSTVMAVVNLTSVLFPVFLDQILQKAVPALLTCIIPEETENQNLVIEIFCRTLFVIGSNPDFSELEKCNIIKTGTFKMMNLCNLLCPVDLHSQELFILKSFQEIANLMKSMETGLMFETSNLQILLIHLIQQLTEMTSRTVDGFILPSGVALRVVLQWLFSILDNLNKDSKISIILATDRILKVKFQQS